jgi:hypothetical protein
MLEKMFRILLFSIFPLIILDIFLEFCEFLMTSISFEMMSTLTWQLIRICFNGVVVVTKDKHYQAMPTLPLWACKKNQSFSKFVTPTTTNISMHT